MTQREQAVLAYADEHQQELFNLLSELIGFDSQNFIETGREKECAAFIQKQYEALGLQTRLFSPEEIEGIRQHPLYLPGRGLEDRPNVCGVLPGADNTRSVMLAAHIDTMPVGERGHWRDDPFGGVQRDGNIYGLGASDNKFGIACGIFAVQVLQSLGITLRESVVLASYVDEEYGGGGGALSCALAYPCRTIVNFDGGNFELWTASLGGGGFQCTIETQYTTDTAKPVVDALLRLKEALEPFGKRRCAELEQNSLYTGSDMARSAYRLMEFGCGSFGTNLDRGILKFVIYTTQPLEQIRRELDEIRAALSPYMTQNNLKMSDFTHTTRFFGHHCTDPASVSVPLLAEASRQILGRDIRQCGACLSDLSIFLPLCADSVNFGILKDFALPGGAHQPNEFVSCEEFLNHAKAVLLFLLRYVREAP